jgi:hypothetical protein
MAVITIGLIINYNKVNLIEYYTMKMYGEVEV